MIVGGCIVLGQAYHHRLRRRCRKTSYIIETKNKKRKKHANKSAIIAPPSFTPFPEDTKRGIILLVIIITHLPVQRLSLRLDISIAVLLSIATLPPVEQHHCPRQSRRLNSVVQPLR